MRIILALLWICGPALRADLKLTVAGKPTQLREARVSARLEGRFLVRDLELTFYHEGGRVAEGDLTCPLAEGEEVVSFAMEVNGVRRESVVVPAKRARYAYETIVARGVDPGLLEVDEAAGEFRTRVFPILSRQTKTVWIRTAQLIKAAEVEVWPAGLGEPEKWSLGIETMGGVAGEFLVKQEGPGEAGEAKLVSQVEWTPRVGLSYRSGFGDVIFPQAAEVEAVKAEVIEVWLDSTVEVSAGAFERLAELLARYQDGEILLRAFHEEAVTLGEFDLKDGEVKGLREAIAGAQRVGLADLEVLPWAAVEADAVVMITDGTFVLGRRGFQKTPYPLHVIDSGKSTSEWMRGRALSGGGGWHGGELDRLMGRTTREVDEGAVVFGEMAACVPALGQAVEVIKSAFTEWLGARLRGSVMVDRAAAQAAVEKFHTEHGVLGEGFSLIVMETARQYREFGIEPPKSDEELYQKWKSLGEEAEKKKEERLVKLVVAWQERCDHLGQWVPAIDARLRREASARAATLGSRFVESPELELGVVFPLLTELKMIHGLADFGVTEEEIPRMKEHLKKAQELTIKMQENELLAEAIIGGQVKQPGRYQFDGRMTLQEIVRRAGGETPFGAINRVKLYRSGKVYTYSLRVEAHRAVVIVHGDIVEVPQTNWIGNGGGGGKTRAPFSPQDTPLIHVEKGDENPPHYYLDALAKAEPGAAWWDRYRVYRAACGWRADFYLNVILFLEERERVAEALMVAGDLANFFPENAEVLRKAAMTYRRLGEDSRCARLCARIAEMEPELAVSYFDLAQAEDRLGRHRAAARHYWAALQIMDSQYDDGRALVILEELNGLLARTQMNGQELGIKAGLLRHVAVELRVLLHWDADQSNLDLCIRNPSGRRSLATVAPTQGQIEWWSGNISRGYGSESWSCRGFLPGTYEIGARFYGDWDESRETTVTAQVEVIRNFGTAEETREIHALRVGEKTEVVIAKALVLPKGWE